MDAKEYLEKEEIDFIKAIGLDMWRDEKVYFVSEVIEFMESYHQAKMEEILPDDIASCIQIGYTKNHMIDAICDKIGIPRQYGKQTVN